MNDGAAPGVPTPGRPVGFVIVGRSGRSVIGNFHGGPVFPTFEAAAKGCKGARGHYWRVCELREIATAHDLAVARGDAEPEPNPYD